MPPIGAGDIGPPSLIIAQANRPERLLKTSEPGTSSEGSASGYVGGIGRALRVVTYPVAPTNRGKSALVTGRGSIQKPSTLARRAGRSSG